MPIFATDTKIACMEKTYQEKITTLLTEITTLKKKSDQISMYRLLLIIGLLILVYQLFKLNEILGGLSIIGGILGFYYLVKHHEKIDAEIDLKETTLAVIQNELTCLEGISGMYYNGQEYGRPTHNFSEDLDIFGEGTLFHLINRTKSKSGSDYLAQQLLGENPTFSVGQKQEAAKEMAAKTDWRLSFFASMFKISNEERGVSKVLNQI